MMHECPPPSSGWSNRRRVASKNSTPTKITTSANGVTTKLPLPSPHSLGGISLSSFGSHESSTVSDYDPKNKYIIITSKGGPSGPAAPRRHKCLTLALSAALVLVWLNSVFLFSQISFEDRPYQLFSPFQQLQQRQKREYDKLLKSFLDDDVSHHDSEEEEKERGGDAMKSGEVNEKVFNEELHQISRIIAQYLSQTLGTSISVKSCRSVDCRPTSLQSVGDNNKNGTLLVFYNPLSQPRFICGQKIESNSMLLVHNNSTNYCVQQQQDGFTTVSTLYPVPPTRKNHLLHASFSSKTSSTNLAPIRLGIKGVKPDRSARFAPFRSCDVKCFHLHTNLNSMAIARTVEGTNWEIATSMEGPTYYKSLELGPGPSSPGNSSSPLSYTTSSHSPPKNRFFATTSFDSDIPLPYFSWDEYAPEARPTKKEGVDFTTAIKGAVFMARNCQSTNQREALVRKLIQFSERDATDATKVATGAWLRIDSVSRCLHNRDPPPTPTDKKDDNKNEILNQYLFYLAFENQNYNDYITEKLWGSLFGSGAVPIYYGAPNIHDHVPPNSIINVRDFPSIEALWAHLVQVANNRTLYESLHEWRKKPLPPSFVSKYNFTHTHSICRMCRWAFAKKYGWGWNHAQQEIEEDNVQEARRLCWDNSTGLLIHPFQEAWLSPNFVALDAESGQSMCRGTGAASGGLECNNESHARLGKQITCEQQPGDPPTVATGAVKLSNGLWKRTLRSHDGILDFFLEPLHELPATGSHESLILEMRLSSLVGGEGTHAKSLSHRQFWLQNGRTRMSFYASHALLWASPASSVVQIFVSGMQKADPIFHLRVIVELLEPKMIGSEEKTYVGTLMEDDFFHPVEKFLITRV